MSVAINPMRDVLLDRVAIVVGGGQVPGETVGNGRAVAIQFARSGARVLVVDRSAESAQETVDFITGEGGHAWMRQADVTDEASLREMVAACLAKEGRIDILHNNVGIAAAGGDAPIENIEEAAFDRLYRVNLRGMAITCKHVLPTMRSQQSGVILNVSSSAAQGLYPNVAYKATKMGVLGLTQHIATTYAAVGIRANSIVPGLLDTPMAIEARVELSGRPRETIRAERNARVPLRGKMGSAWDVAHAAVFLASDLAGFITGIHLPIDGGASARIDL
jgi:NAD(P)-dependent dehydrogenase (short-subunit alcohol dehydrogenase family)